MSYLGFVKHIAEKCSCFLTYKLSGAGHLELHCRNYQKFEVRFRIVLLERVAP